MRSPDNAEDAQLRREFLKLFTIASKVAEVQKLESSYLLVSAAKADLVHQASALKMRKAGHVLPKLLLPYISFCNCMLHCVLVCYSMQTLSRMELCFLLLH